jgi:homoserine kinase
VSIRVRAPASTANLGPGFDCAAIALDLWNEVEVVEGADGSADQGHLGVRAFARLADPDGWSFNWTTQIPRERGLGSSASVIALGLVAASAAAGREADPEELLDVGARLEGHCDNLAAALAGGVCLTWEGRIARLADDVPAVPVAVVPQETLLTVQARTSLPESVRHGDATASLAAGTLLGAALATGSQELLRDALAGDRLHEPYRAGQGSLLDAVRKELPEGALGVTLSGAGPAVVAWAEPGSEEAVAASLRERFPEADVTPLAVSKEGAHAL